MTDNFLLHEHKYGGWTPKIAIPDTPWYVAIRGCTIDGCNAALMDASHKDAVNIPVRQQNEDGSWDNLLVTRAEWEAMFGGNSNVS